MNNDQPKAATYESVNGRPQEQPFSRVNFLHSLISDKCDPLLGKKVMQHLQAKGLDNIDQEMYQPDAAFDLLEGSIKDALKFLGLKEDDPSTMDTPRRFAAMVVGELTYGLCYDLFPKCTVTPNGVSKVSGSHYRSLRLGDDLEKVDTVVTTGAYNQMVLVRDINTMSLCEHHLQTIAGVTHIAYIPKTKVLGLSKFARVTDFFARRPQIQERMTEQIYEALSVILETDDIAVVQDAEHFCMRARGSMQAASRTRTDKMGGRFMTNPALRQEFFDAFK